MRRAIATSGAPQAVGPYSQAIEAGGFVFCAGQIGLDPASGALVEGGVEQQAQRALSNLAAVLGEAGLGLDSVVKTTVFLTSMEDFGAMNEVYAGFFGSEPPARSTVEVAGLPKGARVEVEAIAWRAPSS